MQFGGIGISNLPNQHCSSSTNKTHAYNLIIAGARGLGKTTFLNNLVRKKIFKKSLFLEQSEDGQKELKFITNDKIGPAKSYEVFADIIKYDNSEEWKRNWLEEYKLTFELHETHICERGIRTNFSVLKIDNIGDHIDNTDIHHPIVNYINSKYREYYKSEQENRRDEVTDMRVHACLYFFEPAGHWISEIDKKNIFEISKVSVVIPVVARSDMFTMEERQIIRENLHKILWEENITLFKNLEIVPFFVVSNKIDEFGIVYERQYLWGSVPANNKYMCDTEELKNVIIRDQMLYVIEECNMFYRLFRSKILKEELIKYVKSEMKVKINDPEEFERFLFDWKNEGGMVLE